jgi:hypothetical protein
VHVALEVQDSAHAEPSTRTLTGTPSARWSAPPGEAWLWLAGLLVVISLSLADGLLGNVVAYERDTTVFYFPLMSWLAQQLHAGVFPLWTPQFFGGYPIFADGEVGLAYPPVLLALLSLPPERAFIALRLVHLALAGGGMFFLARTWRLPYPSAALAGVVFTLGSFLQAQIHHENIVRTASWLPLILACVEKGLQAQAWPARLRWTALAALSLGLAGLSLHSQLLAIELLVLAGYGAFRWAVGPLGSDLFASMRRRWIRRFLMVASVCVPVVVFGLGVAALQIIPLVELASFSARGGGIPYDQAAAYSVTPFGLVQLVLPYFFRGQGNLQWGLWTHWESYLYIGLAPLVLVVVALGCVRSREVAGWAALGAVGLVLSLGQYSPINLHYLLWLLPGLSGLRAPGRFTFVVILAAAMLAAYGLAWLMSHAEDLASRRRLRRVLVGLACAAFALTLLLVGLHLSLLLWQQPTRTEINAIYLSLPRDSYPLSTDDVVAGLTWSTNLLNPRVLGGLLGLAGVIAAVWLWRLSPWRNVRAWRGWPALFVALAAVDLLVFGWAIHPRESLATISDEPAAVQSIEQLPSVGGAPNRVLASPVLNQVAPDRLAPFGTVQEANGYSSLEFVWHRDYLDRVLYVDDALLDLWDVRYILDPAHYGKLSSFGGVEYLPQQALLHAPAGGALAQQRFSLAGQQAPVVELRFVSALVGAVQVPQGAPVAEVELRDGAGQVVATAELQAGRDSMDWAGDVPSVRAAVQHGQVMVAGTTTEPGGPQPTTRNLSFADLVFDRGIPATTVTVRAAPPSGEFVLYGAGIVGSDGSITQLFGKTDTRYRQVYADNEIRVLENSSAYPRAFLVPNASVAPSLGTALSQMIHQPFQPDQQVILADDSATQSTGLSGNRGGRGTATITSYQPDAVQLHTSADGDAWLVLSDTYYPGWTATIDGQSAPVLRGDVLFRVVPVPAGEHDVELRFEPTSVKVGLALSLVSLVSLAGVLLALTMSGKVTWRRRTT